MAKIEVNPLLDVTVEDIQSQMAKVSYLLHGNLDADNIYQSGTKQGSIQKKIVTNAVDETHPVEGFKFFGEFKEDSENFSSAILSPLLNLKNTNIQPLVLEGETSFVFNNSTMEKQEAYSTKEEKVSGVLGIARGFMGKTEFQTKTVRKYMNTWEKRTIILEKTPFIKPMTVGDYAEITGYPEATISEDFWINFTFYSEYDVALFQNNFRAEVTRIDPDEIEITCWLSQIGFRKDDFLTLQLGVQLLCKEVL